MTDKTARGRFVWHELATPDSAASQAFYSKALGWKTQPQAHDPSYSMFAGPSGPIGGAAALDAGEASWTPYIGTTDLEKTLAEVTRRGGTVKKPATAAGTGGQYAIMTDPQGATFGVYASSADPGRDGPPKRGEYSWHELATTDGRAAVEFYTALFGWEKGDEHDMGPMGTYFLLKRNGRPLIGIFNKTSEQPGPAWLGYVRVKDLERTVKKVKSAGGTLINGPMEVPGGDWIAQFLDPQGAPFAAHVLQSDLQTAAAEPAATQPKEAAAAVEKFEDPAPAAKPAASSTPARKAARKKPAAKKPAAKTAQKKKSSPRVAAKAKPAAKSAKRPARKAAAAKAGKKKAVKKKAAKKTIAKKSTQRSGARKPAKTAKKKAKTARKAK
jgi:predicted enzyme related to lactoylglutathione lyase